MPIVSAEPPIARQVEGARAAGADLVELRVDRIGDVAVVEGWLSGPRALPCIVTVRDAAEGGAWTGSRKERIDLIRRLAGLRPEYVDVELATWRGADALRDIFADGTHGSGAKVRHEGTKARRHEGEHRGRGIALGGGAVDGKPELILSFHDFERTPANLNALFDEIAATPAGAIKGAFAAADARDALRIAEQVRRHPHRRVIALAMGEAGVASRVLARKLGGWLVYAAMSAESASAPGQPTVAELRGVYRWDSIGADTRVFGVIGWPVAHSMGPRVHNAAMAAAGIDGVYVPLPVEPRYEAFADFMASVENSDWLDAGGFSVTLPHKEHALRWLREARGEVSATAAAIGAVNTLVRTPAGWRGENTDAEGIAAALNTAEGMPAGWFAGRRVDLLGAGGAARAAMHVLACAGCEVTVYNRKLERAEKLAHEMGCAARPWEERGSGGGELLVNCTSVGQWPRAGETPIRAEGLSGRTAVFDMVYNPRMTRLLKDAAAAGCTAISGTEMFAGQAEAQHRLWHGSPAPAGVMREALSEGP